MNFKSIILILCVLGLSQCKNKQNAIDPKTQALFDRSDSMTARIQASGNRLDSITNLTITETNNKIKYFTEIKNTYNNKIIVLEKQNTKTAESLKDKDEQIFQLKQMISVSDATIKELKLHLNRLNSRVSSDSLKLISIQTKLDKAKKEYELKKTVSDDETIGGPDNLLLNLVDQTKKGVLKVPGTLTIYLLPANDTKPIKNFIGFDAYCNEKDLQKISGYKIAKVSKGIYFFKNVPPGKYLIKICTYYGAYKLVTKVSGQQTVTLEIAPPIQ